MSAPTSTTELERKQAAKDLLLAEHHYLTDAFLKNEQTGETRVNWLIGIVTGSIGALVALITKGELPRLWLGLLLVGGLASLLGFGVVTLFRIITRNRKTDGYKQGLDKLRQLFADHFDSDNVLTSYHPFGPSPTRQKQTEKIAAGDDPVRKFGGLTHMVAAINALLAGALAACIVLGVYGLRGDIDIRLRLGIAVVSGLIVVAASFLAQWDLVIAGEREGKEKLRQGRVTHAGGVVFTESPSRVVQYLIVRPTDNKEKWVLPKGKIEERENHSEAALREVREEAGVDARIIRFLDTVEYEAQQGEKKKWVKVKFYLMEKVFETKSAEDRKPKWLPYDGALEALSHRESKYLLALAERLRNTNY